jgi:uncharacterized protein (TIGR00730 family)
MPGGWGTLEELTEMLTWRQLGIHAKPIGVLNTSDYFGALLQMLQTMIDQGFVRTEHGALFEVDQEPAGLLGKLLDADIKQIDKWADDPLRRSA